MRSSGRNYEAWREGYLGHADGTGVGARGTAVGAGAANPRNTKPGRDGTLKTVRPRTRTRPRSRM